jgi:ParB-like nuclease domain.
MQKLELHPLSTIFPPIVGEAFNDLVADIKEHGLREPIALYQGRVIDGRNRLRACEKLGIAAATKEVSPPDPLAYVVSINLRRRHLRDGQRALIAARLANVKNGENRYSICPEQITVAKASDLLNVKSRTLHWARQADRHASPEIVSLVEAGKLSVSAAGKISKLSASEQTRLANVGPAAVTAEARKLDRKRGRQGRSEYSILWAKVDAICSALEEARLDKAHIGARQLVRELERIAEGKRK